jgi:hypothetical protein
MQTVSTEIAICPTGTIYPGTTVNIGALLYYTSGGTRYDVIQEQVQYTIRSGSTSGTVVASGNMFTGAGCTGASWTPSTYGTFYVVVTHTACVTWSASSGSKAVTITRPSVPTVMTLAPHVTSIIQGNTVTMTGTLKTEAGATISGQAITMLVTRPDGTTYNATVYTNASGVFTYNVPAVLIGNYTVKATSAAANYYLSSTATSGFTSMAECTGNGGRAGTEYTCWNGEVIFGQICVNNKWTDNPDDCDPEPSDGATRNITYCWDGSIKTWEQYDAVLKRWVAHSATCPPEPNPGERRNIVYCWDGVTPETWEQYDYDLKRWVPMSNTCPVEPLEGSPDPTSAYTCWDGSVIYTRVWSRATHKYVSSGQTCPVEPLEGSPDPTSAYTCWDGSTAYARIWSRAVHRYVDNPVRCNTVCKENAFKCVDNGTGDGMGTEYQCLGDNWSANGLPCTDNPCITSGMFGEPGAGIVCKDGYWWTCEGTDFVQTDEPCGGGRMSPVMLLPLFIVGLVGAMYMSGDKKKR